MRDIREIIRFSITYALTLAVVLGLGLVLFLCLFNLPDIGHAFKERLNRKRFDSVAWQVARHGSLDSPRIRMVDDLLRRHRLVGMTRAQAVALLGEPDNTVYFSDWNMVYRLGWERRYISIDSEWLLLRLNAKKEVSEVKIDHD